MHALPIVASGLLATGFASLTLLDPVAARQGEAPLFFRRLRPSQMPIAVIGLLGLLGNLIWR